MHMDLSVRQRCAPARMAEILLGYAVLGKLTVTDFGERAEEMKITFLNIFKILLKCKLVRRVRFGLIYDGNKEQFLH